MQVSVTEFKAKCLAMIERVRRTGEPLTITKRGKQVAELRAKSDSETDPWERLAGSVEEYADPYEPSVADAEIEDRLL